MCHWTQNLKIVSKNVCEELGHSHLWRWVFLFNNNNKTIRSCKSLFMISSNALFGISYAPQVHTIFVFFPSHLCGLESPLGSGRSFRAIRKGLWQKRFFGTFFQKHLLCQSKENSKKKNVNVWNAKKRYDCGAYRWTWNDSNSVLTCFIILFYFSSASFHSCFCHLKFRMSVEILFQLTRGCVYFCEPLHSLW